MLSFFPHAECISPPPPTSVSSRSLLEWRKLLVTSTRSVSANRRRLIVDLTNDATSARFTVAIIDCARHFVSSSVACGVVIIPVGRESEYVFSHIDGQCALCRDHCFDRLVLVALNRGHSFGSFEDVQNELRAPMKLLAPANAATPIPFLAVATDIGERRHVADDVSAVNGAIVVEDVVVGDHWHRRMIFTKTALIQSEARLRTSRRDKPPLTAAIDHETLTATYQQTIVATLALRSTDPARILLVGLGGGNLAMYLHRAYGAAHLLVAEISAEVKALSEKWFGFKEDDRMTCCIQDGMHVIQQRSEATIMADDQAHFDCIIVDCNSDDLSDGLSFPPHSFLTETALSSIRSLLSATGLFVLNLGCRAPTLRHEIIKRLCQCFTAPTANGDIVGRLYQIEENSETVNIIMAAVNGHRDDYPTISSIRHCLKQRRHDAVTMELIDRIASIRQIKLNAEEVTSDDVPMGDATDGDDVTTTFQSLTSTDTTAADAKRLKARAKKRAQKERRKAHSVQSRE